MSIILQQEVKPLNGEKYLLIKYQTVVIGSYISTFDYTETQIKHIEIMLNKAFDYGKKHRSNEILELLENKELVSETN